MSAPATCVGTPSASFRLDGYHALVTGASRGIGAAIAVAFAAAGAARLTLVARSLDALEEVARSARRHGADATALACDVADVAQLQAAFTRVDALDVLVCSAGANVPQPLAQLDLDVADALWALNVRAGLHAAREATRRMRAGGVIVFLSSQMGHVGAPRRSVYCATKHAVEGMTRALAVELAPRGVRVVALAPTFVDTDLTLPFLADPGFRADVVRRIPLGRLATVDEVAAAAVFAASPAAGSLTGCSLRIDGGWTAQ
ncbi:SDR family NAD(P)-dependent oxidoreductase [Solirubrobacter soli]|uniref:SDR family NAD(P)-dependent oxidoreductase n=1 Tax=Solirubrobacter soli TaxID=363832 RepID=UPI00041B9987|nr:SDR family oxidoreductase [Solirubrobacter soli]